MVVRTPNQRRSITSDMSDEEAEPTLVQPLIDLVSLIKSLCETLGRNVAYQSHVYSKQDHQVQEMQFEMANGERDLRKKIDIVYRVFKQASQKLNRVDRNWQEVIDAQVYIVEELRTESSNNDLQSLSRKEKAQSPLEQTITDFQFVLGRAIEGVSNTGLSARYEYNEAGESIIP